MTVPEVVNSLEQCGSAVILLDGLPASPAQMGYLHALATLRKIPLHVVELTAPPPVLRRRTATRDPHTFTKQLATWQRRACDIRNAAVVRHRPYLVADTATNLDDCAQRIWATCTTTARPSTPRMEKTPK